MATMAPPQSGHGDQTSTHPLCCPGDDYAASAYDDEGQPRDRSPRTRNPASAANNEDASSSADTIIISFSSSSSSRSKSPSSLTLDPPTSIGAAWSAGLERYEAESSTPRLKPWLRSRTPLCPSLPSANSSSSSALVLIGKGSSRHDSASASASASESASESASAPSCRALVRSSSGVMRSAATVAGDREQFRELQKRLRETGAVTEAALREVLPESLMRQAAEHEALEMERRRERGCILGSEMKGGGGPGPSVTVHADFCRGPGGRLKMVVKQLRISMRIGTELDGSSEEDRRNSPLAVQSSTAQRLTSMYGSESSSSSSDDVAANLATLMMGVNERPFVHLPSRKVSISALTNALRAAAGGEPTLVSVCSGPFLGKSRIVREVVMDGDDASMAGFTVLTSFRTSVNAHTSYFPFRQIVLSALQKCASHLPRGEGEECDDEAEDVNAPLPLGGSDDAVVDADVEPSEGEVFTPAAARDKEEATADDGGIASVEKLMGRNVLNKTDRLMIGNVLPKVLDSQPELLSLLRGHKPADLAKSILASLLKLLRPLQPVAIVFEADGEDCDVDPSSWTLLSELVRAAPEECPRLLLVVTSRVGEEEVEKEHVSAPAPSPFFPTDIAAHVHEVRLRPLDRADTDVYLRSLLDVQQHDAGVDEALLDAVHNRARGCPLFAERIVTWAEKRGMIERDESRGGLVVLRLPDEYDDGCFGGTTDGYGATGYGSSGCRARDATRTTVFPSDLGDVVLEAFRGLPPDLWDAMKIASCIGSSFDSAEYEGALKGGDLSGFLPNVRDLEETYAVFERLDDGRVRWRHRVVYEAVQRTVAIDEPGGSIEIHARIVQEFEKRSEGDDAGAATATAVDTDPSLLARHSALADRWDSAFRQYMDAGGRAEARFNFSEAENMYRKAIECQDRRRTEGGNDHGPSVPTCWSSSSQLLPRLKLGTCLRELARYEEAEVELKMCMDGMDGNEGSNEATYLQALAALATLYQAQSKYREAKSLYERVLPIARGTGGSYSSSLWLAGHIAGYAEILRKSGELIEAEKLHREALELRLVAAEGGSCTDLELAVSHTQLGCTVFGLQQYDDAHRHHRLALITRFKQLDFSHGLVSESLNYCAEALQALGRGCEGIPLGMHAVQIRRTVFGASHPAYAHALSVLASCYHSVGRSHDALDLLDECLGICERAFSRNHANMIPNLMSYGNVLRSTGNYKKALEVYERAVSIHQLNFTGGRNAGQLEKCRSAIVELSVGTHAGEKKEGGHAELPPPQCNDEEMMAPTGSVHIPVVDVQSGGTPIIVLLDMGSHFTDEFTLALLTALSQMNLLSPIAVVTTRHCPQNEGAFLARAALDALGLSNVPVGVGCSGSGDSDGEADRGEFHGADYARPTPCYFESSIDLISRALESSPNKSVQLLCTSNLAEIYTLMNERKDLFAAKVKEIVVLGYPKSLHISKVRRHMNHISSLDELERRCEELGISTYIMTSLTTDGFPISSAAFDDLSKTEHMVSTSVQRRGKTYMNQMWKKVNMSPSDPRRNGFPSHCDRTWFCQEFFGNDCTSHHGSGMPIWCKIQLDVSPALALLSCVPTYRETRFQWKTNDEGNVTCASREQTGIVDVDALTQELLLLVGFAFRNALQNIQCI